VIQRWRRDIRTCSWPGAWRRSRPGGRGPCAPSVCQVSRARARRRDVRGPVGAEQLGVVGEAEVLAHELETQFAGEESGAVAEPAGVGGQATITLLVQLVPRSGWTSAVPSVSASSMF
jgi:hypothetical protein